MRSQASHRWRALATVAFLAAMAATTAWGLSDHFPFTPMTQFAGSVSADDSFRSPRLLATFEGSDQRFVKFGRFGIRRAEFEGQMRHHRDAPERLLAILAGAYARFNADGPRLQRLRLVYRIQTVEDRRPGDIVDLPVATWDP